MARSERIAAIARDQDFLEFVEETKRQLTGKVMSTATSPEDREKALTEYHALSRLMSRMACVDQPKES